MRRSDSAINSDSHRFPFLALLLASLTACQQDRVEPVEIGADFLQLRSDIVYQDDGKAWEATLADFDRDGNTDILISGHNPEMFIRYYRSGSYEPSSFRFQRALDRHACDAADIDGDGYPDLYCTHGAQHGSGENANELWLGTDGVRFTQIFSHGAESAAGRGRYARFFNYDGDGRPDLYVTNYVGLDVSEPQVPNQVFVNIGGSFEVQPDSAIAGALGCGCIDVADINNDGIDDLVICTYDPSKPVEVLLSEGPRRYRKLPMQQEAIWMDARFADLNGDGVIDLLASTSDDKVLVFFNRRGEIPFSGALEIDVSGADSRHEPVYTQIAAADIDHDGAQDFYLARRLGIFDHSPKSDLRDLLLLGPDWKTFVTPPGPASGLTHMVYGMRDRFLVINAGRDWEGSVEIVRAAKNP